MPLATGTRLGPYEILASIGAGGMGEVYKARDTRLERLVALKVIQGAFADSPEMRERFEREARAISSLDHPNICILYDVCRLRVEDASAGQGRDEVSFLVMQYLEGETLADRLARAARPMSDPTKPASGGETSMVTVSRGPIPFDTALKYGAEIAQALDVAHRRGIVHRDLKPGNVMLTKTGIKLLDFGLAKLAANESGVFGFGGGDGATRTTPLTSQGALLGTLQYMSPEQLDGREVDARSDIHAFGALLFEMLSGRRAFEAPSQAGIISAIIGGDTPTLDSLADTRASLPVGARRSLDRLLARCLAKDPDERWHSGADLANELRWIVEERQWKEPEPASAAPAVAPATSGRREKVWMGVAAAALVALAGVAYAWYPRAGPLPGPVTFNIAPPDGTVFSTGPGLLAVSPDGRRVAFTTFQGQATQLWVREIGSLAPQRLERADGAWHPAWSPDGRSLVFAGASGIAALRRIDLGGGPPTTLAPATSGRPAWGSAGVILFQAPDGKLYRVPDTGGQAQLAMDRDATREETDLSWPLFLPDGQRYLFLARAVDSTKNAVFLASLGSSERTHLFNALSSVEYADGHLFYQRDGTLVAHPFDASSGRLTGEAFPVIEDVRFNATNGRVAVSISASGAISYVAGSEVNAPDDRRMAIYDVAKKSIRHIGQPGRYTAAVISPDGGRAIASMNTDTSRISTLWLVDLERGVTSRFTAGSHEERYALFAPDGASVVYQSLRDQARGLARRGSGGGETKDELLYPTNDLVQPTGFSSDGQRVLFTKGSGPAQAVWMLSLSGDRQAAPVFSGAARVRTHAVLSPDNKWIAFSEFPGPTEADVYVEPFPSDGRLVRVSTGGGRHPRWSGDGKRLFYRREDDAVMSVEFTAKDGKMHVSTPVVLFSQPRTALNSWFYSIDKNATRFMLVLPSPRSEVQSSTPITVVLNFTQGLGKR